MIPDPSNKYQLSSQEVRCIISKFARMTRGELEHAAARNDLGAIEIAIATLWLSASKHGDVSKINALLDRAIGKPDAEKSVPSPKSWGGDLDRIPRDELRALLRKYDFDALR